MEETELQTDAVSEIEPHESSRVFLYTLLANLAVQLLFGIVLSAFFSGASTKTLTALGFLGSIFIQAAYVAVYVVFVKKRRLTCRFHLKNRISAGGIVLSVLAAWCVLGMFFLPAVWVDVLLGMMGYHALPIELSAFNIVLCVLATILLAPVIEELVFRGVLLSGFTKRGMYKAIVLSSLAFSLSHLSPSQTVYQFFVGIACAVVVLKTDSLWAGIVLHLTSNLTVLVLELTAAGDWLMVQVAWLCANPLEAFLYTVAALGVFGGILFMVLAGMKNHQPSPRFKAVPLAVQNEKSHRMYYVTACIAAMAVWLLNLFAAIFM